VPESPGHRKAVVFLVHAMRRPGLQPVAAAGGGGFGLPDPPRIGRHEPDALAADTTGWVIGEVKLGPELFDHHMQEQLHDFTRLDDADGRPFRLVLVVPSTYRRRALAAVREAGGRVDRVTVVSPAPRPVKARPAAAAARTPLMRVQRPTDGFSASASRSPRPYAS
jgi:hypothetical protein